MYRSQLNTTYSLTPAQIDNFKENQFIKLKDVFSEEVLMILDVIAMLLFKCYLQLR